MKAFHLSKLFVAGITLIGALTALFFLLRILPGDPTSLILGEYAVDIEREKLREALGLHKPLILQYLDYCWRLLQGDLGNSLHFKEPVLSLLTLHFIPTLQLGAASMVVALGLGVPLGMLAAARAGSFLDSLLSGIAVIGISIPHFWLGPLLILLFSYYLGLFPISGMSGFSSIVLPALTLGTSLMSVIARMVRASFMEVIKQDYVTVARAKGLSEWGVFGKHALRNAFSPVLTIVGLQVGALLSGSIVTEVIFDWPGLGLLLYRAVLLRDYPLIQGCILLMVTSFMVVNMVVDGLYLFTNPRLRGI